MHRTGQVKKGDLLHEEDAEGSLGKKLTSLEPCAVSELAENMDEKLNLTGQADVDSENSISGLLEDAQELSSCESSTSTPENESKGEPESEGKADADATDSGQLVSKEVDKASAECKLTPEEFEKVIKERKAERKRKAEEKRQEGLRRIREMNSRDGIHPVEDLFPQEIWQQIVEGLSPQDRYYMCLVHPFFNSLMKPTKIQDILLPLALDYKLPLPKMILLVGKRLRSRSGQEFIECSEQVVTLRSVSKGVRDAVDKWIEDDLLHSMRNAETILNVPAVSFDVRIKNVEDLSKRISVYTNSVPIAERPRRFFVRSLHLFYGFRSWGDGASRLETYDDDGDRMELYEYQSHFTKTFDVFNDSITEFLEKVGDQILFLDLVVGHTDEVCTLLGVRLQQIRSNVRKWLLLLPNLKWLKLDVSTESNGEGEPVSMPRFNALERMDLWVREPVPSIMQAVIAANSHVKYVVLDSFDLSGVHPAILRFPLERVESNIVSVWRKPELFQQIPDSSWKLKKIKLFVDKSSLDEIFQFLQEYLPTLEDVFLDMSWKTTVGKKLSFLRLPNLKHFYLKSELDYKCKYSGDREHHFFFDLPFLFYCSKLESLTWNYTIPGDDSKRIRELISHNQNMRFINFPGEGVGDCDLSRSKVWEVFPDLKVIKVWQRVDDQDTFAWIYQYRP